MPAMKRRLPLLLRLLQSTPLMVYMSLLLLLILLQSTNVAAQRPEEQQPQLQDSSSSLPSLSSSSSARPGRSTPALRNLVENDNDSRSLSSSSLFSSSSTSQRSSLLNPLSWWRLLLDILQGRRPLIPSMQCSFRLRRRLGDDLYRDDSVLMFSEAGRFEGANNIREFTRYAAVDGNPFVQSNMFPPGLPTEPQINFRGYNATTGQCEFLITHQAGYVGNPNFVSTPGNLTFATMTRIFFDFTETYVTRQNVFYTRPLIDFMFGNWFNTMAVREFVCDVIEGPNCGELLMTAGEDNNNNNDNNNNSTTSTSLTDDCVADLENLPVFDNLATRSFQGASQACRVVHASFVAAGNPQQHCPHIAFPPGLPDNNGDVKCQQSSLVENPFILPTDLFEPQDFQLFREAAFQDGFDPEEGFVFFPQETRTGYGGGGGA